MAVNYTSLLGLVQPVDGTEAGTWGDDVNNGISSILDVAVAGTQNITTDGNVTLTITQATSSGTNLTSTSAQYAILLLSGSRSATRTVTLPASSKTYTVLNSTTGGYSQTVGGVTVAVNEYCTIAYNTSAAAWVKLGSNQGASSTPNVTGGSANQILYQTGTSTTNFITAPTGTSPVYLSWTSGGGFTWASSTSGGVTSITAGTGLSASSSTGSVTLTNIGVTSLSAGTGISLSSGTGAITISATGTSGVSTFSAGTTGLTPSSATSGVITLGGTLNISNGGTGATTSSGALTTLGASPAAGSSSITTVGTISSGTWQGTRIADSYLSTNVGLLSATNAWSGQNNFGSGTPGYTPPSSPYLATIYSNAANTTSGIGLVTAAYYNTQSNWDAIVQTTSQTIASFSQGTPGGALTTIGSINYNGTGTTYGTTSDRRLKENIAALPAGTGLEKIAALQPRSFTWKQNGAADMGFIADELQAVVPNAVSGSPDAVREDGSIKAQAVDTSFLVVYLVQAVQEMAAEIVTLKAKVGI